MTVVDELPPQIREIVNRTPIDYLTLEWSRCCGTPLDVLVSRALRMEQAALEQERNYIKDSLGLNNRLAFGLATAHTARATIVALERYLKGE
jgi:hypothetical protein